VSFYTRDALIQAVANGGLFEYLFFWGHRKSTDFGVTKSCFSQWYEAPFRIEGEIFRTAEHYMMVRKARLFGDEGVAKAILGATTPNDAKSLGRKVHGFSEQTWLNHREEIVLTGNAAKFGQRPDLKNFLLGTEGSILVEASPVDPTWGMGMAQDNPLATFPASWPGLNLLGFALMKARDQLRQSS